MSTNKDEKKPVAKLADKPAPKVEVKQPLGPNTHAERLKSGVVNPMRSEAAAVKSMDHQISLKEKVGEMLAALALKDSSLSVEEQLAALALKVEALSRRVP